MTTSKWEQLEVHTPLDDDDIDGKPIEFSPNQTSLHSGEDSRGSLFLEQLKQELSGSEGRRAKLREIELKVLKFQDELELGKRSRKSGITVQEG